MLLKVKYTWDYVSIEGKTKDDDKQARRDGNCCEYFQVAIATSNTVLRSFEYGIVKV